MGATIPSSAKGDDIVDSLLFNTKPIAPNNRRGRSDYAALFQELQGDIIKEHGRDYTLNLLVRFKENTTVAARRRALSRLAGQIVSTQEQLLQADDYRHSWDPDESLETLEEKRNRLFCTLALSSEGYRALGFRTDKRLPSDPAFRIGFRRQRQYEEAFFGEYGRSFTAEMILGWERQRFEKTPLGKEIERRLEQRPLDMGSWDERYKTAIHGMVLLGLDDTPGKPTNLKNAVPPEKLSAAAEGITQSLAEVADVFLEEPGITYYNRKDRRKERNGEDDRKPLEHFGFVDGISNPLFFRGQLTGALTREGSEGKERFARYDPFAPLSLVLTKDPNNSNALAYGSYLVFMKLEQNVAAFQDSIRKLAKQKLGIATDLAEAMVMGRFKDGTPLTRSSRPGMNPISNDFSYFHSLADDDRAGLHCPLHAHIRKVNRRDSYRDIRIVRRGITYGLRMQRENGDWLEFADDLPPTKGVGLLFASYQRDIERQFGTIFKHWAMEDSQSGYDPILGQLAPGKRGRAQGPQIWRNRWGNDPNAVTKAISCPLEGFNSFVSLKGGEYFFVPSIGFLRSLKRG